ncbi:hypothetical protein BC936DRAFT_145903 [Jimgerdemannia flammicorona]|uniref:Uncharacterized protein n=1 Tax=Jimgerdemannia flammicorona TaxID=994334 RepID=A0A433D8Z4_9FUNG|nr:hypothetical protein BC936DRAFT_145903 [Jimgerdemannia flammicorona]
MHGLLRLTHLHLRDLAELFACEEPVNKHADSSINSLPSAKPMSLVVRHSSMKALVTGKNRHYGLPLNALCGLMSSRIPPGRLPRGRHPSDQLPYQSIKVVNV